MLAIQSVSSACFRGPGTGVTVPNVRSRRFSEPTRSELLLAAAMLPILILAIVMKFLLHFS